MPEDNENPIEKKESTWFEILCDRWNINTNLIMLKLTLFVLYGATSSLLPYLTIHMQSVGLTIEEIGMIYLALPFTTFLAPPLTGFLVDKFGKYKPVVIISFLLNALIHHSLLYIPHMETPGIMPAAYVMRHPKTEEIEMWWSPCPSRECPEEEELDIVVDMCVDHCILQRIQGGVIIPPSYASPSNTRQHIDFNNKDVGDKDDLKLHVEKKNKTKTKSGKKKQKPLGQHIQFTIDMHPNLGEPIEALGIEIEQDKNDTAPDFKDKFGDELIKFGVNITALEEEDLRCGGLVLKTNITYENRLKEWAGDCMIQRCQFRDGGPDICPPDYMESDDKIFWIYFALRFFGTILLSAGVTIMDPITLTMIEKYGGDFGRERLFSSLGMALFSPITGVLIDMNSKRLGYTDYSAAFYTYDILLVISAITVYLMPLSAKLPADNIFRDMLNIFSMPIVLLFIFFLFALGNLWGFIESFLFLYLKDLGAPNYLLGVTVTVGTISSMPFLYGAEKITKRIGHVNVIIIAFFAHAGRLVGYSFIENAWWCFPFEAMESLSVHLMWVAAATYCALLAPKSLLATLIGVVGMAHFSIGRGSGSFFGANIIEKVGIREAFRIMGLAAVTAGILYSILNLFWLRKIALPGLENDEEASDEIEKLNNIQPEPKFKNASTMVSFERLSLVMEYNAIGSLSSLGRNSKSVTMEHTLIGRSRSSSIRRGSYSVSWLKQPRGSTSASKVDLPKSANEVNSRYSNPQLKRSGSLNKGNNSISKISQNSFVSIPGTVGATEDRMARRDSILEEIEEIIDDKSKKESSKNSTNIEKTNKK